MSGVLNWELRKALPSLGEGHRLNVLIALILRSNVRMRCYPSMETIAADTGKSISVVSDAKLWLQEHGAFYLVPYKLRVEDEKSLPVRQHVYQLTGVLRIDGMTYPYLYLSPEALKAVDISENEISKTEVSDSESKGSSISKGKSRKIDPIFDAITLHIFKLSAERVKETKSGGRIAKIKAWLKGAEPTATAKDIETFAKYCGGFIPRDKDKFGERWLEWRASVKPKSDFIPEPTPVEPDPVPLSPEEIAERQEQIRRDRLAAEARNGNQ